MKSILFLITLVIPSLTLADEIYFNSEVGHCEKEVGGHVQKAYGITSCGVIDRMSSKKIQASLNHMREGGYSKSLKGILVKDSKLDGVDFSSFDLEGAIFKNTSLRGVDFSEATLEGARFEECDLSEANFAFADLRNVSIVKSTQEAIRLNEAKVDERSTLGVNCSQLLDQKVTWSGLAAWECQNDDVRQVFLDICQ